MIKSSSMGFENKYSDGAIVSCVDGLWVMGRVVSSGGEE